MQLADFAGWPHDTAEAAYEVFGPRIFNGQGRTFKSLNRRIVHALDVWETKYQPLTEEQEAYAGKVLAWGIRNAGQAARGVDSKLFPFVLASLARLVNHERVDAGMKRRAAEDGELHFDDLLKKVPR